MPPTFMELEKLTRRAPLGMRFLDLARGLPVSDGLGVAAWPLGGPRLLRWAAASPLSGVYGFRALPGLRPYEEGQAPAANWCPDPAEGGTPSADELHKLNQLQALVTANANGTTANFAVTVEDRLGRFLPQTLLMCLPKEHLVEVPLFSAPARPVLPGAGLVRGELWDRPAGAPARWALVTASPSANTTYVTVADGRGMFALFMPYASALPALKNGQGSGTLDQLTWPLSIQVLYQPSKQRRLADIDDPDAPPDIRSILEQAAAKLRDDSATDGPKPKISRPIRFGADLIVKTGGQARLLVEPAA